MKPPNEKGTLLRVPIPNLLLAKEYHFPCSTQACFKSWRREAVRLFGEYWRTSNPKHLRAFCRHVVAMRAHEVRAVT